MAKSHFFFSLSFFFLIFLCDLGGPAWCFYPQGVTPPLPHADTYVHLFEWRWPDIALECENFLGPNGMVHPTSSRISFGKMEVLV